VISLQFDPKLYKEDNSLLRIVVSSQSKHVETHELENLITEPLPINGRLNKASLTALSWLSGIMSHTCFYGIVPAVSSGSIIPAFRRCGGYTYKWKHRQQGDLISLLNFSK
jgi:hypothetical protein